MAELKPEQVKYWEEIAGNVHNVFYSKIAKAFLRLNEGEEPVFLFHEREGQEPVELGDDVIERLRDIAHGSGNSELCIYMSEAKLILDACGILHKELEPEKMEPEPEKMEPMDIGLGDTIEESDENGGVKIMDDGRSCVMGIGKKYIKSMIGWLQKLDAKNEGMKGGAES